MSVDEIVRFVQNFYHNKKVITVNFSDSANKGLTCLSKTQAMNESGHCLSSQSKSFFYHSFKMIMKYNTVCLFMKKCINNITYFNFNIYSNISSKYDREGQ